MKTCMFLCFHVNFYMKAQKHACFHAFMFKTYMKVQKHACFLVHVISQFSVYFYPPLHYNGKGSIHFSFFLFLFQF